MSTDLDSTNGAGNGVDEDNYDVVDDVSSLTEEEALEAAVDHTTEDHYFNNNIEKPNASKTEWIRKRVKLPGYQASMWKDEHEKCALDFLTQENLRRMIVFIDKELGLRTQYNITGDVAGNMMYFVKTLHYPHNEHYIQYGTVNMNAVESLFREMNSVYVPMLLENKNWPESKGVNIYTRFNYY